MRNGKGTGDGINHIWTVVTKKTKMDQLGPLRGYCLDPPVVVTVFKPYAAY